MESFTCLQDFLDRQGEEAPGSSKLAEKIWIIDTFPYNGEMVAELRLKHLYGDADEFIIVESRVTHSGHKKEFLYVDRDRHIFEPCLSKVGLQS